METQNVLATAPTNGHAENEGVTVTPQAIEEAITSVHFFTAAEGVAGSWLTSQDKTPRLTPAPLKLLTFCVLTLRNGFTVTGQSACADPKKFNQEIGEKVAYGDAFRQVWPLLGYELRSRLHKLEQRTDDLGEALTRMTAYRLGNPEAFRAEDAEAILAHFETEHKDEGATS